MKLEIKHLAPYLPYGLKFGNEFIYGCGFVLGGLTKEFIISIDDKKLAINVTNYKPLLRPLSDLTREIEIDGKKFVPIVELAKLAYPDLVWEFDRTRAISEWNSERAYFFFNKNSFFACFFNNSIPNQLVLFQNLFEWHFDVFGLIDHGLALQLI